MLTCPKCGFDQPEDQYCAQCGIDMTKFMPTPPTLWRKTLENWVFQLFLLVLLIVTLTTWDSFFSKPNGFEDSPSASSDLVETDSPFSSSKTNESLSESENRGDDPSTALPSQASKPLVINPKTAGQPMGKDIDKNNLKNTLIQSFKNKISIQFYLIQRESLESFLINKDDLGQKIFKIHRSDIKTMNDFSAQKREILSSQRQRFTYGEALPLALSSVAENGAQPLGLFIWTVVSKLDSDSKLQVNTSIQTNLSQTEEPIEGADIDTILSLDEALIFTDLFPQISTLSDSDRSQLENIPSLRFLNDSNVIEGKKELILVLQLI